MMKFKIKNNKLLLKRKRLADSDLGAIIPLLHQVSRLDLSSNYITTLGAIDDCLGDFKELNLSNNCIQNNGCESIAKVSLTTGLSFDAY